MHAETREEHRGERAKGTTPKYAPIGQLVATTLLCGLRIGEAINLRWESVQLDTLDVEGDRAGQLKLGAAETKTDIGRIVDLGVSPSIRLLLSALHLRSSRAAVYVFGGDEGKAPMPKTLAESSRRRLISDFGAPEFSWQLLRSTCATFGSNARGVFGSAAAFSSAKRLGHSVAVADRHYTGVISVSRAATTLEQAMGIEEQMAKVVARAGGGVGPDRSLRVLT